jgi:predicted nucleic-acid-binding Zn-ribbon protein
MSKVKFYQEGVCPLCGSTYIEYGDITWNTNNIDPMLEQECRCTKCQCEYKEQYNVRHTGQEITYEPNSNE